jgi:hypothetical protein
LVASGFCFFESDHAIVTGRLKRRRAEGRAIQKKSEAERCPTADSIEGDFATA